MSCSRSKGRLVYFYRRDEVIRAEAFWFHVSQHGEKVSLIVWFVLFGFLQVALPKPSRRSPSPSARATALWIPRLG